MGVAVEVGAGGLGVDAGVGVGNVGVEEPPPEGWGAARAWLEEVLQVRGATLKLMVAKQILSLYASTRTACIRRSGSPEMLPKSRENSYLLHYPADSNP